MPTAWRLLAALVTAVVASSPLAASAGVGDAGPPPAASTPSTAEPLSGPVSGLVAAQVSEAMPGPASGSGSGLMPGPASGSASVPAVSAPPARVELVTTGAAAAVVLAPVADDGSLAVPDDVAELGWWVGSAPMGMAAGTTLIAGHVDSAEQGIGVFADLRELRPGDRVTVVDGLGVTYPFRVSGAQEVVKDDLPAELFAGVTGPRRLALVTCGGPFDAGDRRYRDNLVVWAEPA